MAARPHPAVVAIGDLRFVLLNQIGGTDAVVESADLIALDQVA